MIWTLWFTQPKWGMSKESAIKVGEKQRFYNQPKLGSNMFESLKYQIVGYPPVNYPGVQSAIF